LPTRWGLLAFSFFLLAIVGLSAPLCFVILQFKELQQIDLLPGLLLGLINLGLLAYAVRHGVHSLPLVLAILVMGVIAGIAALALAVVKAVVLTGLVALALPGFLVLAMATALAGAVALTLARLVRAQAIPLALLVAILVGSCFAATLLRFLATQSAGALAAATTLATAGLEIVATSYVVHQAFLGKARFALVRRLADGLARRIHIHGTTSARPTISPPLEYDFAFSFAGEDREYVEQVAQALKDRCRIFYDGYEQVNLWGRDLYVHLDDIYRRRARFCVIFISRHYARKLWTNHERASAQARAFSDNQIYILPARFDDTEIPGIRPTLGYIDLQQHTPDSFAELLYQKIAGSTDQAKVV